MLENILDMENLSVFVQKEAVVMDHFEAIHTKIDSVSNDLQELMKKSVINGDAQETQPPRKQWKSFHRVKRFCKSTEIAVDLEKISAILERLDTEIWRAT